MKRLPKPPKCRNQKAQVARHNYLEISRRAIVKPDIDYTELYQRFIVNEWAAIKLDDEVALVALRLGNPALDVFFTLLQGPFIQYQVHEKGMVKLAMTRYARCTVHEAFKKFKRQQRYLPQQKQTASAVTS